MANSFCRFLGNQYRIDLNGISPCCYYQGKLNISTKSEFDSVNEKLTNQLSWSDECKGCYEKEQNVQESPRLSSLKNPSYFGLNELHEPDELTSLEIQTDLDCNSACLICGTYSSTTWQKFESKFDKSIKINNEKSNAIYRFKQSLKLFDFFKLKNIGFVNGGEPLKSNTHLLYLNYLDKIKKLQDITISYVTNGSITPCEETIDLWKKAKQIKLNISIDAIDSHFEYLRWPLNFDQVKNNLLFILDLNLPGSLSFSYSVTPFSIFYHDKYKKWGDDFFQNYNGKMKLIDPFGNPSNTYGDINLSCVPIKLRIELIKKYGLNSTLFKIIPKFNKSSYEIFMKYINEQDKKRNLNFRNFFPEIEKYFY